MLVTAVSGLLLSHVGSSDPVAERPLPVHGSGSLANALPINDLLIASLKAVLDRPVRIITEYGTVRRARGPAAIERARFRPGNGTVQVLLRDGVPLEVVLDWSTAQVLSVTPRHDLRWAKLHSAAALGEEATLLSDAIAGLILLLSLSGIWIWWRARRRTYLDSAGRLHRRAGLAASVILLLPAVTGVLLNHRVDLGYSYRPTQEFEAEQIVKMTPARLEALADAAAAALARRVPGTTAAAVDWLDYFPNFGHVAVGFHDGNEVFITAYDQEIKAIMPPRDTWVRQLHSGRLFGAAGSVVTSVVALLWIILTCGGLYLMIRARWREPSPS